MPLGKRGKCPPSRKGLFKRFQQFNPAKRSQKNVSHHYDLSAEFYQLFLDEDLQYSCAYFNKLGAVETNLDKAQQQKKIHIASKLMLSPGMRVLDIGSGWGGMGIFLAQELGANVSGITLSEPQLKVSIEKAKSSGVIRDLNFYLRDYRDQVGKFDRIVSVGMFEHVGVGYYGQYFSKINMLMEKDGIALLHTIGRQGPPSVTDPWIRKYIFPGGYIPALSEIVPVIEQKGLQIADIEFLGEHYAETISHWRRRFKLNRKRIQSMYDEKFCRMWEFYLAGSEVSFRHMGMTVFQIQLVKNVTVTPPTRNYVAEKEKEINLAIEKTLPK